MKKQSYHTDTVICKKNQPACKHSRDEHITLDSTNIEEGPDFVYLARSLQMGIQTLKRTTTQK